MLTIINEDSSLKFIPENMEIRQRVLLDGIRYAVQMSEMAFNRLEGTLLNLSEEMLLEGELDDLCKSSLFPSAFLDIWAIIGSVERLRPMIKALSDVDQHITAQELLEKTKSIDQLRDRVVQHCHSKFDNLLSLQQPIWGSITWLTLSEGESQGKIYTIVAGSIREDSVPLEDPSNKRIKRPVDLIKLHANGITISIVELMESVVSFTAWFDKFLKEQFSKLPTSDSDYFVVADFES